MDEELEQEANQESELVLEGGLFTKLFRLHAGEEEQEPLADGSIVSQSMRPSMRRSQRSKSGFGEPWERNSVRFLQTLLLIC